MNDTNEVIDKYKIGHYSLWKMKTLPSMAGFSFIRGLKGEVDKT
jgi:hypothetical protein